MRFAALRRTPVLVTLAVLSVACDELPTGDTRSVSIVPVTWLDSLPVARLANVVIAVEGPEGQIGGLTVTWESSDSTVLTTSRLLTTTTSSPDVETFSATLTGHKTGSAILTVTVAHPGIQSAVLIDTVDVTASSWPAALTVTEYADIALSLPAVPAGVSDQLSFSVASADDRIITIDSTADYGARLIARRSGRGTIRLEVNRTVNGLLLATEVLTATIDVAPLVLQPVAWPTSLTTTQDATLQVSIPNLPALSADSIGIDWTSNNVTVLTVDPPSGDSATVTAVGTGSAEIRAVARALGSPADFESAEIRQFVGAFSFGMVADTWIDTLNVTNTGTVSVDFQDAAFQPLPPGSIASSSVTWRSSNENVLSVSGQGYEGLVQGVGRGVADVIVTARGELETVEFRRRVEIVQKWISVEAGPFHNCALSHSEVAYCWGRSPQRGTEVGGFTSGIPQALPTLLVFQQLAGGGVRPDVSDNTWFGRFGGIQNHGQGHTCARTRTEIHCWGDYGDGQLGDGVACAGDCEDSTPTEVLMQRAEIYEIAGGGSHTCGMWKDSPFGFQCWGLLDQTYGFSLTPTVVWPRTFVSDGVARDQYPSVAAGARHACFGNDQVDLTFTDPTIASGVYCVGNNTAGQLGDDGADRSTVTGPVLLVNNSMLDVGRTVRPPKLNGQPSLPGPMSAGALHTCGISGTDLYCWGANSRGQLGIASPDTCVSPSGESFDCSHRALPVPLQNVSVVAAGAEHTCALADPDPATGTNMYCWGSNRFGQLGDGLGGTQLDWVSSPDISRTPPAPVLGGHTFTWITAGSSHTCGVDDQGSIWCWGRDASATLGQEQGSSFAQPRPSPVRVTEPPII